MDLAYSFLLKKWPTTFWSRERSGFWYIDYILKVNKKQELLNAEVESPKSIQTATAQTAQIIANVASSQYGGCPFACKGCYNKVAQNFSYGQPYTKALEEKILTDLEASYCQGLTLLGGEPFLNTGETLSLVDKIKQKFADKKDIWSWFGYTWEELTEHGSPDKLELLSNIDILVDGRFILEEKDLDLAFKGSRNQRIIDVQKSLETNDLVLWREGNYR